MLEQGQLVTQQGNSWCCGGGHSSWGTLTPWSAARISICYVSTWNKYGSLGRVHVSILTPLGVSRGFAAGLDG